MRAVPLVSVVVPAYNAERTLKASLDSALAQDFRDFEIIAVNDGSIDSTKRYSRPTLLKFG